MKIGLDDELGWFFRAVPIAVAIAMIAFLFSESAPAPTLSNDEAFGCYSTGGGLNVLIDSSGFRVLNAEEAALEFKLSRKNSGLYLEFLEPPLKAMRLEATRNLLAGKPVSLRVETNLDTTPIVDGFWIAEVEGYTLFKRSKPDVCQK